MYYVRSACSIFRVPYIWNTIQEKDCTLLLFVLAFMLKRSHCILNFKIFRLVNSCGNGTALQSMFKYSLIFWICLSLLYEFSSHGLCPKLRSIQGHLENPWLNCLFRLPSDVGSFTIFSLSSHVFVLVRAFSKVSFGTSNFYRDQNHKYYLYFIFVLGRWLQSWVSDSTDGHRSQNSCLLS